MNRIRKISLVTVAIIFSAVAPSVVQASTVVNFPMTSNGTAWNGGQLFKVKVGSIEVDVRVTAWSTAGTLNSSEVIKGKFQAYSNGLGVTSTKESGSSPNHTIDNSGNRDFLIFQFDQPVELDSAKFTTYNIGSSLTDGDAIFAYGNTATNWKNDLLAGTSTYSQLSSVFGNSFEASNVPAEENQTSLVRQLNDGKNIANSWLIGAAFVNPDNENCKKSTGKVCFDGFKLSNVSVVAGAVPEPSSWLMMIMGFGFVGYNVRRRRFHTANGSLRLA